MSKQRNKSRTIVDLLATKKGQIFMNTAYSLGAAVVILGALFKILHLPGGTTMLMIGMLTEVFIFTLSAFDRSGDERVEWDRVFPNLKSGKNEDNPLHQLASKGINVSGLTTSASMKTSSSGISAPVLTSEQTSDLEESLKHLNESAKQLSRMADLADITESYLKKLSETTSHLDRFNQATSQLAGVSGSLADTYTTIADNTSQMKHSTLTYIEQMGTLNRNIEGLSRVYTDQLQGITTQVRAISQVHEDLSRLKLLFEGSSQEAEVFKRETERMSEQLTQLNVIYSRMINALTTNNAGRPL
ncbi:MAG: gliding motility protein GldL [Bacteroidales bacterium]